MNNVLLPTQNEEERTNIFKPLLSHSHQQIASFSDQESATTLKRLFPLVYIETALKMRYN